MNTNSNFGEKASSFVVGLAILLPGLFFMVLGVTFLPVIGLVMGLPIMALSIRFMMVSLREDAESVSIEETAEQPAVDVSAMLPTIPWQTQIIQLPLPEAGGATQQDAPNWKEAA